MNLQLTYVTGEDGVRHLTLPDEMRARVIAFVREGGAKSPDEIAAIVQEGHDALIASLDGVSDEQARWKPAPGEWSILELMDHVVTIKRFLVVLAPHMSEGAWPPGLTEAWQEEALQDGATTARFTSIAEARDAANASHDALLAFLRGVTPEMNTEKTFTHFLFGAMNFREWIVFERIHDGDHGPTIGRIKALPAYPAG